MATDGHRFFGDPQMPQVDADSREREADGAAGTIRRIAHRHRGIASALIAHCVQDARERGARPAVIGADPTDTPMRMYAAMGFRPLFMKLNYVRRLTAE